MPGVFVDGRDFIPEAVRNGAVAVLAPNGTFWPPEVPPRVLLTDPEPRRMLALIAAVLAGVRPETVVAVTGTNGKTSTVDFLRQIWTLAGHRAASIGTLGLIAPGYDPGPGLTTPDPVTLAEILSSLARHGIQHVAMEASSHGLDQFRLDGVRLAAAGFTNLTRDHLDYHVTMAGYRAAKLRLAGGLLPPRVTVRGALRHGPGDSGSVARCRHRTTAGISYGRAVGLAVPPDRGGAACRWPDY